MKNIYYLILILIALSFNTTAQVKDANVEGLMDKRVLTCDDIYYNSITLIPRLYHEKKMDTLNAVLTYWKKNCGMNEAAVCMTILLAIENNTFREELSNIYKDTTKGNSFADVMFYKNNIISYLYSNKDFAEIKKIPAEYPHFYHTAYVAYSKFTRSVAASLLNKQGLSPAEHFLVEFYANPDTVQISRLADSVYKGSLLQQAYMGNETFGGLSYGLNYGMWHSTGKLAIIGDHPYLGCYFGGRGEGFTTDFVMNFAFNNSPNYITVVKDDSVYHTDYFVGYYIGLDFGQALFRTKRHEIAVLAGIAYDGIAVIENTSTDNKSNGKTLNSLNLNAGLGYKFYYKHVKSRDVRRHSFIGIQAKYNFVSYRNGGGTDLTGNSVTIGISWGGYRKDVHQYYNKN